MWTSACVYSICFFVAFASELDLFNQNGWVPVSSDVVNNQIRRRITQPPRYTEANLQIPNTVRILSHQNYQSHVVTETNITEDKTIDKCTGDWAICTNNTVKNEPGLQLVYDFLPNEFLIPPAKETEQTPNTLRRSKKVADIDTNAFLNNFFLPKQDKTENNNAITRGDKQKLVKENAEDKTSHTYEVTENIIIEEEMDKDETVLEKTGYEYNPPGKKNFTSDLIKYLSKYNIKNNDNLQNYALSRQTKADSPIERSPIESHKPFHFRVPIRYNSLNHLAVDPLLAVFLSNYGYYLQGQYGIQNNYNNLYGYLASNNIHNNKPFGFYKLFSDTDSSQ